MKIQSLQDLYVDELKDLYNAENQLIKALPKMAKAAKSDELQAAFEEHLKQTEQHAKRIETIFEELEQQPKGKKCVGMEGLIEEGKEIMEEADGASVLDAGLIVAAQKVEHYEIAAYGSARAHAEQLGYVDAAEILQETLDEEVAADEKLTQIAESLVNEQADEDEEDEEYDEEEEYNEAKNLKAHLRRFRQWRR
jgi:ferritin-like metal-binding protein YciE